MAIFYPRGDYFTAQCVLHLQSFSFLVCLIGRQLCRNPRNPITGGTKGALLFWFGLFGKMDYSMVLLLDLRS